MVDAALAGAGKKHRNVLVPLSGTVLLYITRGEERAHAASVRIVVDDVMSFQFESEAGFDYELQCSSDMTNWTDKNFTVHGLGQFDSNMAYRIVTLQ